jgi:hypothetical protein
MSGVFSRWRRCGVAVSLYRHPFDDPGRLAIGRCVVVADSEWFEVPCAPSGGWRLRKPYFGPRSGLQPISGPTARELRRAFDDPFPT